MHLAKMKNGLTVAEITIDKNGVDVHRKALQEAHWRPVLHTHKHRVPEDGTHTLLTHWWSLQVRHHEDHPEMHQYTTLIIITEGVRDKTSNHYDFSNDPMK